MRLVVDTNVLVSALLKPKSVPARLLTAIWRTEVVVYDARIEHEYRSVLARPKFSGIGRQQVHDLLAGMQARSIHLGQVPAWNGEMIDKDDRMFIEVALAGAAEALVTGNARHFPTDMGFEVLSPARLLERLCPAGSQV